LALRGALLGFLVMLALGAGSSAVLRATVVSPLADARPPAASVAATPPTFSRDAPGPEAPDSAAVDADRTAPGWGGR